MTQRKTKPTTIDLCLTVLLAVVVALISLASSSPAEALDAISLNGTEDRVEITRRGVAVEGRGDRLQIDTAPGVDGVSRRMSVNATTPGTDPTWIVFALHNSSDKTIERWVTVSRYSLIGSGIIWPDLDSRRLSAVTPSVGFLPQRIENDRADIFKITIDPGQTITYVAEMATARLSRIYLWKPLEYELHIRERRLFNGIMLGIAGLLGIFLTAVFAANHKAIFPSAALVTWCVLIYLCVDFGFWHKLLQISADNNAVYRAATEAAMATSLAIFLHIFLRLGSWHGFVRMLSLVWIIAHIALVAVALLDPRLASTFARLSFAVLGGIGALLILFLAIRGQDRALALLPTWMLFLVWLFGATMTLTAKLNGEIVVSSLVAGLVLLTVLIGFTVTQFAFRTVESHYGAAPSEQQLRSLAVEGAGAAVWEWHARRDEIKVGAVAETLLGLNIGELSTKVKDFIKYMHPADQERFSVLLWSLQNKNGGVIRTDFRMRHADNSYRWFDLEAASIPTSDRRSLRCVGLLRDVTDQKRSQARLMHDAVHDSLTSLPNRELFLDRVKSAVTRVEYEPDLRPTILFIDLDKFKSVNSSFGLIVGDSLLLTMSRRLSRHLRGMDTLARIGGDQFAMLILSVKEPEDLARLAENVRRALRSPVKIAGQDIVLTGAIGIAVHDPDCADELDLLKNAEIAMYRAKRSGADQIEIFRPEMRNERDDRVAIESDLRRAIERRQIKVLYQPIIYLPTEELAGFEALARWEHPKHGMLNPHEFIPVAEESDLIVKLGSYVLTEAVEQAARWQRQLPRVKDPLFVSVNVSSRQLFRQDLIQEIRHIIGRQIVPEGVLRLEITESLVMENPEQAAEILDLLQIAGSRLSLDDFGTGYSSLAYLERFPFDTIKIDRDLIRSSTNDNGGPVIVRSIVAMAQELNKMVVAEGVETGEDVGFLRSIGCQFAQGYYYGEPMGERDVADLLKIVRKSERKLKRHGLFKAALGRRERKDREEQAKSAPQPTEQLPPEAATEPPTERPTMPAGPGKTSPTVPPASDRMDRAMPPTAPRAPQPPPRPGPATQPPTGQPSAAVPAATPPSARSTPDKAGPTKPPEPLAAETLPPTRPLHAVRPGAGAKVPETRAPEPPATTKPPPTVASRSEAAKRPQSPANGPTAPATKPSTVPAQAVNGPSSIAVTPAGNSSPPPTSPSSPAAPRPENSAPAKPAEKTPDAQKPAARAAAPAHKSDQGPAQPSKPSETDRAAPATPQAAAAAKPEAGNQAPPEAPAKPKPADSTVPKARKQPNYSALPPSIAQSLARLAGESDADDDADEDQTAQKKQGGQNRNLPAGE